MEDQVRPGKSSVAAVGVQIGASDDFSAEELDLFRQWFNALQDTVPQYLDAKDYRLGIRILEMLGWPVYELQRVRAR